MCGGLGAVPLLQNVNKYCSTHENYTGIEFLTDQGDKNPEANQKSVGGHLIRGEGERGGL